MSEHALKRLTVDEFLLWDDGTDTRYELIDGVPVAMAPSHGAHQIVAMNLGAELVAHLKSRPPCHVRSEAGVLKPNSIRTYFQADLAVTCSPHERGQIAIPDPVIVVEVLSPSTAAYDRKVKLPVYRSIPSVREIVLVDGEQVYCEVHRRLPDGRWELDLLTEPDALLRLDAVGYSGPLAALYANVDVGDEPADVASGTVTP